MAGMDQTGMDQSAMSLGQVPQDPNLDLQGQVTDAQMQKDAKKAEI